MHVLTIAAALALHCLNVTSNAPADECAMRDASLSHTVAFLENRGQWDEEVLFWARGRAAEATVLADRIVFRGAEGSMALRLPRAVDGVEGQTVQRATTSFFGRGVAVSGVRGFATVRYVDVLPGVDLVVRPDGPAFAYDLLLGAGADLDGLVLRLEGANEVELSAAGTLRAVLAGGAVEQRIGACWEVDATSGERLPIEVRYRLLDRDEHGVAFGFDAPARSRERAMVVDPSLLYSTYLGSPGGEIPIDIATDAQGAVYIAAQTSHALPTTEAGFQPEASPGQALWVGKLAANGTILEWGTFLDGSDADRAAAIAVEPSGCVVVAGRTWSHDFPLTAGGYQTDLRGLSDAFVVRLDPTGSTLLHGTLFGGGDQEETEAMALLPGGDVVLGVRAPSTDLEATVGAFDVIKSPQDRMIVRLSADLSEIRFATWFPIGRILSLETDADGNVYFAGDTLSSTGLVPTTPGAFQLLPKSPVDGVVGKLDPTGSELLWCTYVGGSKSDTPWGMTIDAARAVYLVGQTSATASDYPTTPGVFSNTPTGNGVAFATKLLADGSGLVWSTYIGGPSAGGGGFLAAALVDAAGNLTGVGWQNQPGWPTTPDAFMPTYVGGFPKSDVVISKFDAVGSSLVYSTFFGGSWSDTEPHAAIDSAGRPHVLAITWSDDLPITPGAFQPEFNAHETLNADMAVAAFDLPMAPWRLADCATRSGPRIPNLVGLGTLEPGAPTRLSFRGGVPSGLAWLVLGTSAWSLPLPQYDAVLYPSPDFLIPLPLGPEGQLDLTFAAPAGLGDLFFQIVGFDPAAPGMIYASNGLRTLR